MSGRDYSGDQGRPTKPRTPKANPPPEGQLGLFDDPQRSYTGTHGWGPGNVFPDPPSGPPSGPPPAQPPPPLPRSDNDIYRKWFAFHLDNPHVYREMRRIALDLAGRRMSYGISAITEIARWERRFDTTDEDYKLPNANRSMYSRLLMEQEPTLAGFFDTSELRSAVWPTDPASVRARAASVA